VTVEAVILEIRNGQDEAGRIVNDDTRKRTDGRVSCNRGGGTGTAGSARVAAQAAAWRGGGRCQSISLGSRIAADASAGRRRWCPTMPLDARALHNVDSSNSAMSATAGRGPMTPSSMIAQLGQATASVAAPVALA
jgi:hypothetical protein